MTDPVSAELQWSREDHAAKFNFDLSAIPDYT